MLRNVPLRLKLAMILLLPLLGFLWLAGQFVVGSYETLRAMEKDRLGERRCTSDQPADHHAAARTRRQCVYLGSQGRVMKDRLPRLRADTDEATRAVQALAAAGDARVGKAIAVRGGLQGHPAARGRTPLGPVTRPRTRAPGYTRAVTSEVRFYVGFTPVNRNVR